MAAPSLEPLAEAYAGKGIQHAFLYTREAHPGENFPAHDSFEQKLAHARAFRDHFGIQRPILVDDLDGAIHTAYGLLPNMTYIISQGGKVIFRANWTDVPTVQMAVDYLLLGQERRATGARVVPCYFDMEGHRVGDQQRFAAGLWLAGRQAVLEFAQASERNYGPAAARFFYQFLQRKESE